MYLFLFSQSSLTQMSLSVLLDRVDRALTRTAPLGMSILGISSVYYIAFSYGLGVIALIFGKDGATQVSCVDMY